MITLSIEVMKITKTRLYEGKKGAKYLGAVLVENRNGLDQFGWDGFVAEEVSKEERQANVKGTIIGNWKHIGGKPAPVPGRGLPLEKRGDPVDDDPDSIPF